MSWRFDGYFTPGGKLVEFACPTCGNTTKETLVTQSIGRWQYDRLDGEAIKFRDVFIYCPTCVTTDELQESYTWEGDDD